ncbi:hypothetical protein EGT74_27130 [Chitinophaga lutea]|uniref:Uncharacterized protein n=1 Tax=Chitinophaga lutea TaxID=2488634 RepID=A0A3N4PD67_9BACT|nr:hypothetical protein [Chitinophaga lutea]RPE06025.1 hypothetical protein EGT74_27130 [Chitinophaga lutea]
MILRKEIVEHVSKELSLPFTGTEQDWDIEMADQRRVDEFVAYYKENDLSKEVKYAIMSLILASYDDFLNEKDLDKDNKWNEIKVILKSEKEIFTNLINYWSVGTETANVFRITPLIREVKAID